MSQTTRWVVSILMGVAVFALTCCVGSVVINILTIILGVNESSPGAPGWAEALRNLLFLILFAISVGVGVGAAALLRLVMPSPPAPSYPPPPSRREL